MNSTYHNSSNLTVAKSRNKFNETSHVSFQLQLTNAAFFLTTVTIVDGSVLRRTPVKEGDVAMTTPTTAIILYTAFIQLVCKQSKGNVHQYCQSITISVKSTYAPSGPSGQSLSWFLKLSIERLLISLFFPVRNACPSQGYPQR